MGMATSKTVANNAVMGENYQTEDFSVSDFDSNQVEIGAPSLGYESSKLDGLLNAWVESQTLPINLRTVNGKVSVLILTDSLDHTFGGKIQRLSTIKLNDRVSIVHGLVSDLKTLMELTMNPDISSIRGDEYTSDAVIPTSDEILREVNVEKIDKMDNDVIDAFDGDSEIVDTQDTAELIGATAAHDLGYKGANSIIQISDTGVDFGHSALYGAAAIDSEGNPMSLEPSGLGFALSSLYQYDYYMDENRGNDTEYAQNFAPAHTDIYGDIYVGGMWDDLLSVRPEYDSLSYITWAINYYLALEGYSLPDYYHVGDLAGNETGFAFGVTAVLNGYGTNMYNFVPFLIADSDGDTNYDTLYLDFETGILLSRWWYGIISTDTLMYNARWDFSKSAPKTNDGDVYLGGDVESIYGWGDHDGYNDISIGGLATALDLFNFSGNAIPLIKGIDPSGRLFAHIWDYQGHGTSCSGNAIGRNVTYHPYLDYGSTVVDPMEYSLQGIAPEAKLLGVMGLYTSAIDYGWFWGAGFEPDENNTWTFHPGCDHIVNLTSNSWGFSDFHFGNIANSHDFETMLMDYLSVPGYIDPTYPGVLFLDSSGNGGPGYGNNRETGHSTLGLMVGASTNQMVRSVWYGGEYYGVEQPADYLAGWTDFGPNIAGYPTLDVVNVGSWEWSINPVSWSRPYSDGGYYNYDYFGGTSQACPMTAGAMAVLYGAWTDNFGTQLNPMLAKAIVKATAVDLGYDPNMQGNGRVDVLKMVEYVTGTSDILVAINNESIHNAVAAFEAAFFGYFEEDHPALVNQTMDGSLYFGKLLPNDVVDIDFDVLGTYSSLDFTTKKLVQSYTEENHSADLVTLDYYNYFNFSDVFDVDLLKTADFFQLTLAIDLDTLDFYEYYAYPPFLRIEGFNGTNRIYLVNSYNVGNFQTLFLPTDFLYDTDWTWQIVVRDYGYRFYGESWGSYGTYFNLGIRAFNWEEDTAISVTSVDSNTLNAQLTVPSDAAAGVYQGFVVVNSTNDNHMLVPYGYMVSTEVSEYNENGWTEITGLSNRLNDIGLFGGYDHHWRPDVGDWRYYDFTFNTTGFTDQFPNTLAIELNWSIEGTALDMWVVDASGYVAGMTDYITSGGTYYTTINAPPKTQRLLIDMSGYVDGRWTDWYQPNISTHDDVWGHFTLVIHSAQIEYNDTTFLLEPFSVRMAWVNETVSDFSDPVPSFDVAGDEVLADGTPITDTSITCGWTAVTSNPISEFDNTPYGFDVALVPGYEINIIEPVSLSDFYGGKYYYHEFYFEAGDYVSFTLGWSDGSDLDFYLYDPSGNEIAHAATLTNPEYMEVLIPETGYYTLETEYYSGTQADLTLLYNILVEQGTPYVFHGVVGTDLTIDLASEGLPDASYLVNMYGYGWNYNYEYSDAFVFDTSAPVIVDAPVDFEMDWGTTETLSMLVSEWNGTYSLSIDGTEVDSGIVSGMTEISYDFEGVEPGVYTVSLEVVDVILSLTTTYSFEITVLNTETLMDVSVSGSVITVVGIDDTINSGTYTITDGSTTLASGSWTNGTAFTFDISTATLSDGVHYIKITLNDGYGGEVSDEVMVIVKTNTVTDDTTNDTTTDDTATDDTATDDDSSGGGIPGYATGGLIVVSLAAAALLLKKYRK